MLCYAAKYGSGVGPLFILTAFKKIGKKFSLELNLCHVGLLGTFHECRSTDFADSALTKIIK